MEISGKTDVGARRNTNQDDFRIQKLSDKVAYAVLCDGMGGEKGGAVASENAVRLIAEQLERGLKAEMKASSVKNLLLSAVASANSEVYHLSRTTESLRGMGTTVVAVVVKEAVVHIAYAGDSRVYRFDGEACAQLTRDHSMVQFLVDRWELSPEAARVHPQKHFITRALGVLEALEADYLEEPMPESGGVLLCSDGLSNHLRPEEMLPVLGEKSLTRAVDTLINMANDAGGSDNITAVIIRS